MKGNEAIAEAAIRAGCRLFFGYPITPSSELAEYLARRMPEVGGTFLQAESEVAAINMVYGAAGSGARVMTASSGPGISLKQEGLSYITGAELPCVVVNIQRAGPGLGGLGPSQGDYFQATKGGGHGDYHPIVLGPASVQEAADLMMEAFDLADRWRLPVILLGDGIIGQTMERVVFKEPSPVRTEKPWATTGTGRRGPGAKRNIVQCWGLTPELLEPICLREQAKYEKITAEEQRWDTFQIEDAEALVVAFGTSARICREAVMQLRAAGLKVGLLRPITLWPFPGKAFQSLPTSVRGVLAVELSMGQMVEDVRLAVNGRLPVRFFGRVGGFTPSPEDVAERVVALLDEIPAKKAQGVTA
ncbi:MAG: 3-methyl-2-oxobutanoate dehydrogenase subunit VorB [Firmicutes bacterium]|nr:3-methyl-2-oxobutanoate dehydrogenase subunit VorB [Bacillota bacterium]